MTQKAFLQNLADRAAISDVVLAYATAVDTRNWAMFRSIFTDRVALKFGSFGPGLDRELAADELLEITKKIANFTATQHISSNHVHTIAGDKARCRTYAQASHFLTRPDGDYFHILYGHYDYSLVRTESGWKIDGYSFNVAGQQGDPRVYGWAGFAFSG
jgi:hypothetical protein